MKFPPAHWRKVDFISINLPYTDYREDIYLQVGEDYKYTKIPSEAWSTRCQYCWARFNEREERLAEFNISVQPSSMALILEKMYVTRIDYQHWILVGSCLQCGTVHWVEVKEEDLLKQAKPKRPKRRPK